MLPLSDELELLELLPEELELVLPDLTLPPSSTLADGDCTGSLLITVDPPLVSADELTLNLVVNGLVSLWTGSEKVGWSIAADSLPRDGLPLRCVVTIVLVEV